MNRCAPKGKPTMRLVGSNLFKEKPDFKGAAIDFARTVLNNDIRAREKKGTFDEVGWKKCADFGIQGLPMPEEYGGQNADILDCISVMEGLGYGCSDSGLLFALNSHIWTCESPILKFGTKQQIERFLPGMINGTLKGGHAITEPNSGSDAFRMGCRAERREDRYILNGTKMFITNAPIADVLLVFATTAPEKKFAGISAFIVEKHFPGFSVGKPLEMMGLKTCPIGEVIFEECEIPEENRLGKEGAGSAIFNAEMEWEKSCLFATHVGAMEKILEESIRYAKMRYQFGNPISEYQAISHKISEMRVRIELSHLILGRVANLKRQGKRAPLEAAIAKLFISESYLETSLAGLHIHGAYGYSTELDFERNVRDAVAGRIYSGTSEIQKNIIANFLGL